MTHAVELSTLIEIVDYDSRNLWTTLSISELEIDCVCVALELLDRDMIDKVRFHNLKKSSQIDVCKDNSLSTPVATLWSDAEVQISLSKTALDFWLVWLLRMVRNGYADVNHIDIELDEAVKTRARDLVLTIQVPNEATIFPHLRGRH